MSGGVNVIRYLLANNAPLIAVVPATRIMAGDLPLNVVLPAVSVKHIDGVPLNNLQVNETPKVHTDRVQVTALCKGPQTATAGTGYAGVKAILALVLAACPSQYGTVNNVAVQGIMPDIEGPDFSDESIQLYTGSRDFLVRWHS